MKTGSFQRSYPTTKTVWIVEGYSDQQHCPMYPHEGWSWTEWKPTITDTYKTFEQAREAISHGYLRDMIKYQGIRDIRIYEEITEREIVERKTVRAFTVKHKAVEVQQPIFATAVGEVSVGDHLILGNGDLYGRVFSIHDKVMRVDIINGRWTLILDISGAVPIIHPSSPRMDDRIGEAVPICHLGVPDPENRQGYDYQLEFYHDHFDNGELTSTLTVGYTEPDME